MENLRMDSALFAQSRKEGLSFDKTGFGLGEALPDAKEKTLPTPEASNKMPFDGKCTPNAGNAMSMHGKVPDMKKIMPDMKKAAAMPAMPSIPSGPVSVFVNNQSVVHKDSMGITIAFPDVCNTQIGNSVVPIPYPNISRSSDMDNGSVKTKMDGNSICVENSNFKKSMGDEAGTLNGFISGKNKGKSDFINFSFDVQVENKGVCRGFDLLLHNDKNTPPSPLIQPPLIPEIPKMDKKKNKQAPKLPNLKGMPKTDRLEKADIKSPESLMNGGMAAQLKNGSDIKARSNGKVPRTDEWSKQTAEEKHGN
jgi:hypothetical protein